MKSKIVTAALMTVLGFASVGARAEEASSTPLMPADVLGQQVDAMDAAYGPQALLERVWFRCEAKNAIGRSFFAEGRSPERTQQRAIDQCSRRAAIGLCHSTGCNRM